MQILSMHATAETFHHLPEALSKKTFEFWHESRETSINFITEYIVICRGEVSAV